MEPIPYFFDHINRNAVVIKCKKPFFDWLNNCYEEDEPVYTLEENNIYLIKSIGDSDEIKKWIKQHYSKIFDNELNDWCTDEAWWPKKRTYKMFTDWFDFEVCSLIRDIEDEPIIK